MSNFRLEAEPASPLPLPAAGLGDGVMLRARTGWAWTAAGLLLAASAVALSFDTAVSRWCLRCCGSDLRRIFQSFEPFGHGVGVVCIVLAIHQLDVARRWALPRLVAVPALAGIAADLLKLLVIDRVRPRHWNLQGTVWDTFGGWLPLNFTSSHQSFPSGHTATAVAFALVLGWLYPRGRIFFGVLATLVALQRVISGAHYCSDVLAGAAVGLALGALLTHHNGLTTGLDRLEARWGRSDSDTRAKR